MRYSVFAVVLSLAALLLPQAAHAQSKPLEICTDYWPPYVNAEGEGLGELARVVNTVLDDMGREADWVYFDFSYCRYRIDRKDRVMLSFPWFRTPEREVSTYLSDPLFEATTRIYFNRRFSTFDGPVKDYSGYTFGRVASYSYGDEIDKLVQDAIVFPTERAAIEALLKRQIDLLPMTEGVARAILKQDFPNRLQLILPLEGPTGTAPLRMMAPRTPAGKALIHKFNESLKRLTEEGVIQLKPPVEASLNGVAGQSLAACGAEGSGTGSAAGSDDIARIVASEGFPVVLGRQDRNGKPAYLALPQGTKVIVLCWSPRMTNSSGSDRLYKTMVDESRVVVLDGPHVGEEVLVKNMHLAILNP